MKSLWVAELVGQLARAGTENVSRRFTWRYAYAKKSRAGQASVYSEGLLVRIATHLNDGLAAVDLAYTATRQALTLVTHWREGR